MTQIYLFSFQEYEAMTRNQRVSNDPKPKDLKAKNYFDVLLFGQT